MGGVLSSGPYPDNPLVGNRPMKFPYTYSAMIAQFPYKFMWKYSNWYRFFIYAMLVNIPIFYKIEQLSYSPKNVEEWKIRRENWYKVRYPPEYDLY